MSPALLSKRLRALERAGVVDRTMDDGRPRYTLTMAGEELRPVVDALGRWGVRWIGELGDADLDTVIVDGDLRALTRVWRGDIGWRDALRSGGLELRGTARHRRALPGWFRATQFAAVPRGPPTPA